jgi:PAS domain S-box-containing protein
MANPIEKIKSSSKFFGWFMNTISGKGSRAQQLAEAQSIIHAIGRSQGMIEFNLNGIILTANENFLNPLGYTLDEIQGVHHRVLCEESYANSVEYQSFWGKLNRGEFDSGEYKRVGKDGNEVWIQATYNPIFDSNGKLYKIVKFATEITEQKMNRLETQGKIDSIEKSQGVIEFNMDGTIITANENFLNTLGYTLDEVQGVHHRLFCEESYANSFEYLSFWEKLNRGEFDSGEYKRIGKNGKEAWIQATYNPIFDLNGKPTKIVKFATDITENFIKIKRNDWLISGQNQLSEQLREASEVKILAQNVITFLANYLEAQIGALYIVGKNDTELILNGSYAFSMRKDLNSRIEIGKGLVGQAAIEKEIISVTNIPKDYTRVSSAIGDAIPRNVIIAPFVSNNRLIGVVELGSIKEFSHDAIEFLKLSIESVAVAFLSVLAKEKEKELLEETQRQSEELESQQEELRRTNEELYEKADSLETQKAEIQKKNEEIEQKAEDLALSSKYKSEFLANMSHELRTPLNSMLLLSNSLVKNKDGNLKPDQIESMSIIHNGGKSLLNLINEILDLSKIEAGMTDIEVGEVSIQEVASDLKINFAHVAENKGLELNIAVNEDLGASIFTDKNRLHQILKNFLSNAIKFTDKGSVDVNFSRPPGNMSFSRSELNPEKVIAIAVTDSGIGIPPDKQKMIFEAFQQADGGTTRKYGGTGLGLSISRELSDLLGGEIQVQSVENQGATFTLYLPLNFTSRPKQLKTPDKPKTQAPSLPKPKLKTQGSAIQDDRDNLDSNNKPVILIIEDDPHFAKILQGQCNDKGLMSLLAPTGEEGLDLANHYFPKGIILDINLPGIDGWFVLNALKDNPRTRHIPVHIMSIDDNSDKAVQQGAVNFITKPVSQDNLDAAFAKLRTFTDKKVKDLLIVEDDEATQKAISNLIGNSDVKITGVGTGKETIQALESGEFECVILDLKLPDMSGFELLDELEKKKISIPPIIVYTGKELTKEENNRLLKYANSIIVKGVHSEERLLDESALFLHQVVEKLPQEKQKIIHDLHNIDQVFKDKKVMVVDDDMRNIFAISRLLQEKGIETIKAESGPVALEFLEKTPDIDLVLMDIMMPEMDGYETMRRIREQKQFAELPIIALTAKAMRGDREKCIDAGASDYIPKPVDEDRLFSMMRIWLYR